MAALFVHCCFRLSSWYVCDLDRQKRILTSRFRDYLWATLALYATVWLFRIIRTIYNSGISLQAHVTSLTSPSHHQLLHIRVPVSSRVTWRPGQHVFLRFWGLGVPHAFSSHPWTVSSLPSDQEHAIELVLRVHGGITKYLARQVEAKAGSSLAVWVDGPYGGVPGGLAHYDEVVLLAGGSGEILYHPCCCIYHS
jgi:predicted ferric reductase